MNAFLKSELHSPVIWMIHGRSLNNKISKLNERCWRIIYNDKKSNFEELFIKNNSVSIHHRYIQTLAIEMYKLSKITKNYSF